ncbi:sugar phosphate isomerase/epimerase family protein [Bauldia sp.]|uniref:sugar phosphate isomerase/epimerase family protein n=1 Tax=Bauldia sp. TaxID=2575872 RepID=UPI003BAA7B61
MANWNLGVIDSAWFGSKYEGLEGLRESERIGFDSLDYFVGFDPEAMTAEERADYLARAEATGLPVISLVCTCLGLTDFNPSVRDFHIRRAKAVVDLAADFKTARNICFVPGEYMFQKRLLPPEGEWELLIDATRQVGQRAAEKGLEVAIELLPFEFAFINSVDSMERCLDDVGLDNVKATIDISHMWLMRIPPKDMARFAGRISHVHISDCDGVNHGDLPPGRGNTPFNEYLSAIRDTGFEGTASLELEFPINPDQMREWVGEAFTSTATLLSDAGVRPN